MNAARAMGNTLDPKYIPELIQGFEENQDERVKGMIVWAMGRIGGKVVKSSLEGFKLKSNDLVKDEIEMALRKF